MKTRTAGRRASDKELSHQRKLERILRNFITHVNDQPERYAPRTREMVKEVEPICADLDTLRAPRTTSKSADNS
jgi:hypothetical protein